MNPPSPSSLRHRCFSAAPAFDRELAAICSPHPSHAFLANPASQTIYGYLLRYLRDFAESWTGKPASEIKVLDWGCGKGHCTFLLRKLGFQVTSCDIRQSAEDSAFGQDTPIIDSSHIEVLPLTDPVRLPFEAASFDIVLSMGVLEHVPDDLASLREIHRILAPRGLLFCFFLPFVASWTQFVAHRLGNDYHDRLYTRSKVDRLLASSGFSLQDFWHRQLLPKNSVRYPAYHLFERADQLLVDYSPLRFLATNIEFVAAKDA